MTNEYLLHQMDSYCVFNIEGEEGTWKKGVAREAGFWCYTIDENGIADGNRGRPFHNDTKVTFIKKQL